MKNYLIKRLESDAAAVIAKSEAQHKIAHHGLRGRFREIFVTDLLRPWLPPVCACGTGTIICGKTEAVREGTQDDIVIYDRSLVPPILAGHGGDDGVFLYNGVLLRIEIKSTLRSDDLKKFATASVSLAQLELTTTPAHELGEIFGALNMIFAFGTDLKTGPEGEFGRFRKIFEDTPDYKDGTISAVCVVGVGFWMLRKNTEGEITWHKLKSDRATEQIAHFVAIVSGSSYREHLVRSGQEWNKTLAAGVSLYIAPEFEEVR